MILIALKAILMAFQLEYLDSLFILSALCGGKSKITVNLA